MKQHIPNGLTLMNLACGFASLLLAKGGYTEYAAYAIFLAAGFDVLDGLAARALKVESPMGAQLDSLADMVSFGVVPAFLLLNMVHGSGIWMSLVLILIPLASAIRLARFNLRPTNGDHFEGLPTPANGLFLASLALFAYTQRGGLEILEISKEVFHLLAGIIAIQAFLLVSRVPFFSLKFSDLSWRSLWRPLVLVAIGVPSVCFLGFGAAIPLMLGYLLLSLLPRRK